MAAEEAARMLQKGGPGEGGLALVVVSEWSPRHAMYVAPVGLAIGAGQ